MLAAQQSAFGLTSEMIDGPPPVFAQMLKAFRPALERGVRAGGARGVIRRWPLDGFFDGVDVVEKDDVARVTREYDPRRGRRAATERSRKFRTRSLVWRT